MTSFEESAKPLESVTAIVTAGSRLWRIVANASQRESADFVANVLFSMDS